MQLIDTDLPEVKLIAPRVFGDERGFFYESFNQQAFSAAIGREVSFVQDNHSRSARGVLRGLHFQRAPHAQAKLVRCTLGEVFDVAVDIRPDSPTFGCWTGHVLSAQNQLQMWIPEGFAHGFLVLSEWAEFLYKTNNYYAPASEGALRWDDPELGITWPMQGILPQLSAKDAIAATLTDWRKQQEVQS